MTMTTQESTVPSSSVDERGGRQAGAASAAERVYERLAGPYDLVFGPLLDSTRKLAVELLGIEPGMRVLEIGIGTGLSLPLYPRGVELVGIDPAVNMLAKARQRVEELGLDNVELVAGGAEQIDLPDRSFDRVLASSVLSVIPNPEKSLAQMARVVRPGGFACVVSHFAGRTRPERVLDRLLEPFTLKAFGYRMTTERALVEESAEWEIAATRELGVLNFSTAYLLRRR